MIEKELKILNDFPPVSYDAWKAQAVADLKGVPFERKMITHTYEALISSRSTPRKAGLRPTTRPASRAVRPTREERGRWDIPWTAGTCGRRCCIRSLARSTGSCSRN